MVVICSKFITFAVTKTIGGKSKSQLKVLWFAQNSLPLRWQRQFQMRFSPKFDGCDLLKIHYLCGDKDNFNLKLFTLCFVVICSKFITFAVTKTIRVTEKSIVILLWFAQNSLPLRWQRQYSDAEGTSAVVVICSKFITFAVTKTISWSK